ncbi:DUF4419 domain-containing protein [bacterium]|nr:DUF4419 domain-containing protein [bacterium]
MITNRVSDRFITFPVHDVAAVTNAKVTWKAYEGINALLTESEGKGFRAILSCSGYNSNTIRQITNHALIEAVHTAFAEHRPLSLSPDMLWITIMQGVAQHVHNNPEGLRKRLVSHQGKMKIVLGVDEFNPDSPESDWQGLIDGLGGLLKANIGETYDELMADFSTTGPLEKTVCAITILDAYEAYFEYVVYCVCGIPSITLEGTVSDWRSLREKIEILAHFEMDWWLSSLRPIIDQFVRAAEGDIDSEYWQNIYKLKKAYGWDRINGWIARLIPYIRHGQSGSFSVVNPLLAGPFVIERDEGPEPAPSFITAVSGLISNDLPSGLSIVPFSFEGGLQSKEMQLIGGFVGIEQVGETQAIRPKLGWAVRHAGLLDGLFASLSADCIVKPPLAHTEFENHLQRLRNDSSFGGMPLPGELSTFYRKCDGIKFSAPMAGAFRSMTELERVCLPGETDHYSEAMAVLRQKSAESGVSLEEYMVIEKLEHCGKNVIDNRRWLVFFDLPDGTYLAVDLEPAIGLSEEERRYPASERYKPKVRRIDPVRQTSLIVCKGMMEALSGIVERNGCL